MWDNPIIVIFVISICIFVAWLLLHKLSPIPERCHSLHSMSDNTKIRCLFNFGHRGPHYAKFINGYKRDETYWENTETEVDPDIEYFDRKIKQFNK